MLRQLYISVILLLAITLEITFCGLFIYIIINKDDYNNTTTSLLVSLLFIPLLTLLRPFKLKYQQQESIKGTIIQEDDE